MFSWGVIYIKAQNKEISGMVDAFGLEIKDGKIIVDESKLEIW